VASCEDLPGILHVSSLNKVLLGVLRGLGYEGGLRRREEWRYRRFMSGLKEVVGVLRGLDYALFKFRKPVLHVSVDIDVLINDE